MSQFPSLIDCRVTQRQCLVRKAETEKDNSQKHLRVEVGVDPDLMDKRAVSSWIVKREHRFEMRSRQSKFACMHQIAAGRKVTQNKAGRVASLSAQTQQIRVQAHRKIEFTTGRVITRLPKGDLQELRGRTQLLPQFSCAGVGVARFGRREAFGSSQRRAHGAIVFELTSLAFGGVWQQCQLIQSFLELRGRFRHRRAGGGSPTGPTPERDGSLNEPGL